MYWIDYTLNYAGASDFSRIDPPQLRLRFGAGGRFFRGKKTLMVTLTKLGSKSTIFDNGCCVHVGVNVVVWHGTCCG